MSGTAFGTVILHVTPEAWEKGPLAVVEDGDYIRVDAERGILELEVSTEEMALRLERIKELPAPARPGGYLQLYLDHVLQADEGCDFDFLVGCRGADVPGHSH
jgi:dihydroxyacid dehydratase/phosphogluconate dehydratase